MVVWKGVMEKRLCEKGGWLKEDRFKLQVPKIQAQK